MGSWQAPDTVKRIVVMAATTVFAELAVVNVVIAVAVDAARRRSVASRNWLAVAVGAVLIRMGTIEQEARLCQVIEAPAVPADRVVTCSAICA